MTTRTWWLWVVLSAGITGCECTPAVQVCSGARCRDSGMLDPTDCDPTRTDNATRDTDCDGLSDAEEYTFTYGLSGQTSPCDADTDNDGLPDGLELGRTSSVDGACTSLRVDADPRTRTSPTLPDSDGDGLPDGTEDPNNDGRIDPGESDPGRIDSDCDGVSDADEVLGTAGCRSNALSADTDGDGLSDGIEAGATAPGPDARCNYPATTFDADPSTKTSACNEDTDGDGIIDGAEDTNANGRLDQDELDPLSPLDSAGPAGNACTTASLRPVSFHTPAAGDIQLALLPRFAELTRILDATSEPTGLMFYDPTARIAGLAVSRRPVGATAIAEENDVRGQLVGMSGAISQTFTTWDGFNQSVRATYDISGGNDLKAQANALARALLGENTVGLLPGTAGVAGPFKLQAEYVRRTSSRSILLFAFTPALTYADEQIFALDDVAGGSALAQVGDFTRPQCEVFEARGRAAVDFLWVVDNSCSMAGYQQAVGNAGNQVSQRLDSAGLNWRAGAVTTAYYLNNSASEYRPFVNQTTVMQQWFTQNSPTWFGIGGTGNERSLLSAQRYIQAALLPLTDDGAINRIRRNADLHLIVLGDADDQAAEPVSDFSAVFRNYDGAMSEATVHGVVCPQGQTCGESQATPRRNLEAIAESGGVLGDINVAQSGSPQLVSTLDAIMTAVIARTGHQLHRPPIATTLKVAIEPSGTVGVCTTSDVPRSRASGYDFDAARRKMVFFGDCRPKTAGTKVAVSYRYWVDASPDPNGDPCQGQCAAPLVCQASSGACVCAADCGGCTGGLVCDPSICTCVPDVK